ncbi:hypothetical protein E1A91_A02G083000v1 [Gossypium mustelinum]|uniref:Uncharacterized protein n=1 Tax=Gossypium mustelinum TaxID=34275 RepID=A0A5D3A2W1_GOSMU|nr:hypothetical protein E1A91_A02G083000v1 [Gossypium mustelinum]
MWARVEGGRVCALTRLEPRICAFAPGMEYLCGRSLLLVPRCNLLLFAFDLLYFLLDYP